MSELSKEEKKALYDSTKQQALDAGLTDKKLLSLVASGKTSLEEALRLQGLEPVQPGVSSEQGQDLAGKESGPAGGSSDQGTAEENKSAANDAAKNPGPAAELPKVESKKAGEKAWSMKCNVSHDGVEFHKGQVLSEKDKHFEGLKLFLE